MGNKEIARKVLDYWFAIEFLGQDSYESCTEESRLKRELAAFKKSEEDEKNKRKQIAVFESIDGYIDIRTQIMRQAQDCGMSTWGNITFYLGKVKRQKCIEILANGLGVKLEQAEMNSEYIPVISFQCAPNGRYINHSLSLSTIVWAISQVCSNNSMQMSELISDKGYLDFVEELENRFWNTDILYEEFECENVLDKNQETLAPVFCEDAISVNKVVQIYNEIVKIYGRYLDEASFEKNFGIKYQLFKDLKSKEKYDDDNYLGLSHDFFSNDIKMVRRAIGEGKYNFDKGMLGDLINYICAPYEILEVRERHDLVNPKDKSVFMSEMAEILNIGNAPIAKWPSRYMPALMQQVAINIAISNNKKGIFEKNGKVFSVNGPPGTGKTTLLKEIIASNIVEKAILLSRYETPDEAFEGVKFVGGKFNGAYERHYPKWYRFKDDKIADYGILVTSSNNTAVENITKELPMEIGIQENLKIVVDGEKADDPEMQRQLEEIRKLFLTSETNCKVNIYQKDTKRNGEYPEIYFTGYASKLLGTSEKDAETWGLVAAPLGKKRNINGFYYNVLNPMWQDFLMKNSDIEERVFKYRNARNAFCKQLRHVQHLQSSIKEYCDIAFMAHQSQLAFSRVKDTNSESINENLEKIGTLEQELNAIQLRMDDEESEYKRLSVLCEETESYIRDSEKKIKENSNQEIEYKKQSFDAENSVSFFTKIFRRSKYQSALELAQMYRIKAQECVESNIEVKNSLERERITYNNYCIEKQNINQKLIESRRIISQLQMNKELVESKIQKLEIEIEQARNKAQIDQAASEKALSIFKNLNATKTGKVFDEEFVNNIFSKDEDVATQAQVANTWATEEYNREREKLFYLALQMTKEFLLSSKACRTNLCILGQYWGLKSEDEVGKIKFEKEDSQAMIGSLFQTLFLLTPVISSTFASVGRLLKDVTEPGCIGTLVIDEAGQAQPQMAVGALFRSRKAIIVGDPKQVQPVVTDDLKLLKESYSDPIYGNYKNKSLSVQSCADIINPFGTFFDNGTDYPDWVGCPLIVHRRCISPMYEISNRISYDGIMKQQTLPPSKSKELLFIYPKSQWINVVGSEEGHGNHYVPDQGKEVCRLVEAAFRKVQEHPKDNPDGKPKLYIISPFTSVVNGIRDALGTYARKNKNTAMAKSKVLGEWLYDNIGTVHKFQGKEANEVIFVLGCDLSQKEKYAVKGFVNSNIVNVAATRAKYRLYIVGDMKVWERNEYVNEAKSIIDTLPIENIAKIERWEESEDKNKALLEQALQLPNARSFVSVTLKHEDGELEYNIDSQGFVSSVNKTGFLDKDLSDEQYCQFGFSSRDKFDSLSDDIKRNLFMGMKLYYLLKPIYEMSPDLDASCCGILFCKGMELYLRNNFANSLKILFPNYKIKTATNKMVELQGAQDKDFMIGTIQHILRENVQKIGDYMVKKGETDYSVAWWNSFNSKLKSFAFKRNECCHPQWFKWQDLQQLLEYVFEEDGVNEQRNPKIGGVFYESENGRKLN